MGEIVNLRMARKRQARIEKEQQASENRTRHGQPKSNRDAQALNRRIEDRRLSGHLLDMPKPPHEDE